MGFSGFCHSSVFMKHLFSHLQYWLLSMMQHIGCCGGTNGFGIGLTFVGACLTAGLVTAA